MTFTFTENKPGNSEARYPLISGSQSSALNGIEYVVCTENEIANLGFEIRYEYHCGPFKEALFVGDILAVGHEEYFYLYSLKRSQNILALKMDGYFGSLLHHNGRFYVADSAGVYCIATTGAICWHSPPLGVDGVLVHDVTDQHIHGSGEWDPPGGWQDFVIDIYTGALVE